MNSNPTMVFLNRSFDKKRLKALLLWFRLNLSEGAALKAVEILQGLGFRSATQGAISLGLDDLKTPASKSGRVFQAQLEVSLAHYEHYRGNRTPVELFQHLVDTWHRTSQDLTAEVVKLFHSTERVNPVYMMAFSGARGNISQVRQLVAMRGLMADPRGQIVGFPILSNFREGLTITEYFVSCYGARKGVVDTAIRTADAGYLTRRLADVSHHVVVRTTNCGTHRSIRLRDIKEGQKTILSLANRLVGRVLAERVSKPFGEFAQRNEEITPDLASKLSSQNLEVPVRSPLSCSLRWGVCQLCYGWGLSEGRRVTLGEAVGIIAAQSIGEPGTQLTLRTFHTGGVFSGDLLNEIRAPYAGTINFSQPLQGLLVRTPHGQIAFLTKVTGKMILSPFYVDKVESTGVEESKNEVWNSNDNFSNANLIDKVEPHEKAKTLAAPFDKIDTPDSEKVQIGVNINKGKQVPDDFRQLSLSVPQRGKTKSKPKDQSNDIHKVVEFSLQPSTVIFVRQKEQVYQNQLLAEFSSSNLQSTNDQIEVTQQVLSETAGQIWFKGIHYGNRKGPGSGSLGTHFSSQKLGGIWVLAGKPTSELLLTDRRPFPLSNSILSKTSDNRFVYPEEVDNNVSYVDRIETEGVRQSRNQSTDVRDPRFDHSRQPRVTLGKSFSGQSNNFSWISYLYQLTDCNFLLESPQEKLFGCYQKFLTQKCLQRNDFQQHRLTNCKTSTINLQYDYIFLKYHYSLGYSQLIRCTDMKSNFCSNFCLDFVDKPELLVPQRDCEAKTPYAFGSKKAKTLWKKAEKVAREAGLSFASPKGSTKSRNEEVRQVTELICSNQFVDLAFDDVLKRQQNTCETNAINNAHFLLGTRIVKKAATKNYIYNYQPTAWEMPHSLLLPDKKIKAITKYRNYPEGIRETGSWSEFAKSDQKITDSVAWWLPKEWKTTPGVFFENSFFVNKEKPQGQLFWLLTSPLIKEEFFFRHDRENFSTFNIYWNRASETFEIKIENRAFTSYSPQVKENTALHNYNQLDSSKRENSTLYLEGLGNTQNIVLSRDYKTSPSSLVLTKLKVHQWSEQICTILESYLQCGAVFNQFPLRYFDNDSLYSEGVRCEGVRSRQKVETKGYKVDSMNLVHHPLPFLLAKYKSQNIPVIAKLMRTLDLNWRKYSAANRKIFSPLQQNYTFESFATLMYKKLYLNRPSQKPLTQQFLSTFVDKPQRIRQSRQNSLYYSNESRIRIQGINTNNQKIISFKRKEKIKKLLTINPFWQALSLTSYPNQIRSTSSAPNLLPLKQHHQVLLPHRDLTQNKSYPEGISKEHGMMQNRPQGASAATLDCLTPSGYTQVAREAGLSFASPKGSTKSTKSRNEGVSKSKPKAASLAVDSVEKKSTKSRNQRISTPYAFGSKEAKTLSKEAETTNNAVKPSSCSLTQSMGFMYKFPKHSKKKGENRIVSCHKPVWLSVHLPNEKSAGNKPVDLSSLSSKIFSNNNNWQMKSLLTNKTQPFDFVDTISRNNQRLLKKQIERNDGSLDQHIVHTIHLPIVPFLYIIQSRCESSPHLVLPLRVQQSPEEVEAKGYRLCRKRPKPSRKELKKHAVTRLRRTSYSTLNTPFAIPRAVSFDSLVLPQRGIKVAREAGLTFASPKGSTKSCRPEVAREAAEGVEKSRNEGVRQAPSGSTKSTTAFFGNSEGFNKIISHKIMNSWPQKVALGKVGDFGDQNKLTCGTWKSGKEKTLLNVKTCYHSHCGAPVQGNLLPLIRQNLWEEGCSNINALTWNSGNQMKTKSCVANVYLATLLPIRTIINPESRYTFAHLKLPNINRVTFISTPIKPLLHPPSALLCLTSCLTPSGYTEVAREAGLSFASPKGSTKSTKSRNEGVSKSKPKAASLAVDSVEKKSTQAVKKSRFGYKKVLLNKIYRTFWTSIAKIQRHVLSRMCSISRSMLSISYTMGSINGKGTCKKYIPKVSLSVDSKTVLIYLTLFTSIPIKRKWAKEVALTNKQFLTSFDKVLASQSLRGKQAKPNPELHHLVGYRDKIKVDKKNKLGILKEADIRVSFSSFALLFDKVDTKGASDYSFGAREAGLTFASPKGSTKSCRPEVAREAAEGVEKSRNERVSTLSKEAAKSSKIPIFLEKYPLQGKNGLILWIWNKNNTRIASQRLEYVFSLFNKFQKDGQYSHRLLEFVQNFFINSTNFVNYTLHPLYGDLFSETNFQLTGFTPSFDVVDKNQPTSFSYASFLSTKGQNRRYWEAKTLSKQAKTLSKEAEVFDKKPFSDKTFEKTFGSLQETPYTNCFCLIQRVWEYSLERSNFSQWVTDKRKKLKYSPFVLDLPGTLIVEKLSTFSSTPHAFGSNTFSVKKPNHVHTPLIQQDLLPLPNTALASNKQFTHFSHPIYLHWYTCQIAFDNYTHNSHIFEGRRATDKNQVREVFLDTPQQGDIQCIDYHKVPVKFTKFMPLLYFVGLVDERRKKLRKDIGSAQIQDRFGSFPSSEGVTKYVEDKRKLPLIDKIKRFGFYHSLVRFANFEPPIVRLFKILQTSHYFVSSNRENVVRRQSRNQRGNDKVDEKLKNGQPLFSYQNSQMNMLGIFGKFSKSITTLTKPILSESDQVTFIANYQAFTPEKFSSQGMMQSKRQGILIKNVFNLFPGQLVAYGDNIAKSMVTTESGQVLYVDSKETTLRRAQTVLIYSQAIIAVSSGEWIQKGTPLMALSYQKLVTGDIVQGLPKIEQFFEAPVLKDGTFWSDSLQAKLNQFFQEHKKQLPLAEAVRKGFSEIQRVLVEGVQQVYISQGVLIADKHLEVIVRQMTCKGRILYSGDTGFLRNELVSLDKIESVNQVTYGQKALYHPQVRGITDASLESESFLSAASFQETTRVLSRDAIIGKTDLMRGLKERVIVGELIQAGTGLANNNVYNLL